MYHALEICCWWASHHVICRSCLFCVLYFPLCEAFTIFLKHSLWTRHHVSLHWGCSCGSTISSFSFENESVYGVRGWWKPPLRHHMWCCACPWPSHKKNINQSIFLKIHIFNILKSSGGVAVSWSAAWVDADGFICGIDVCEERAVDKHVHRALVIQDNLVWV